MKCLSIKVPLGNSATREVYREQEVSGEVVGPFLVHRAPDSPWRKWTVTHIRTGFSAQRCLQTKFRAKWLAKKLSQLACWDFDNPDDAKLISKELLDEIRVLRGEAQFADLQGR